MKVRGRLRLVHESKVEHGLFVSCRSERIILEELELF
jgi:hypothetical protein